MIKGEVEKLRDLAKSYVCRDDGGMLSVVWNAQENSHVLRCEKDHFPEMITKEPSLTQLYKQGEELPEPIASNVKKSIEKRAQRTGQSPQAAALPGIAATDLATGEQLSIEMVKALANYAWGYGLDPVRGHVCLMHGKPYITIDGYLYHANKSKRPFTLESRPIDKAEFDLFGLSEGCHAWLSKVRFADDDTSFTGIGVVTKEEMTAKSKWDPNKLASPVVAAHPWQLAQKRGDWQVLRRAFPIGESPQAEEE